MFSRRSTRWKLLALVLAGGLTFSVAQNCTIFGGELIQTSLNYTWFLTCDTDTLFTGNGLLLDCANVDSSDTTTGTTTNGTGGGLTDLLGS